MRKSLLRVQGVGERARVKRVDQKRAMREHCALVDGALVGDFASIERRRIGEQAQASDARGAAR